MKRRLLPALISIGSLLSIFCFHELSKSADNSVNSSNIHVDDAREKSSQLTLQPSTESAENATIWVSMGLCWGETTQNYGKSNYPYATVTPLAALLWRYFLPEVNVLVRIIYEDDPKEKLSHFFPILDEYVSRLERTGAVVEKVPKNGSNCILKSQLSRTLAFTNPRIEDDDVVVTFDVNGFVMNDTILDPIYEHPRMRAWIFQYADTAGIVSGTGETFNQNLIALRAKDWKRMLGYEEDRMDFNTWLSAKEDEFRLNKTFTWYHDQWITTLSLLKMKYCNVPEDSGLWNNAGLKYEDWDDGRVCFHGYGYKDCNKDMHIVFQGCKWYHFFPEENFAAHVRKFHELTNNYYNISLDTPF